MIARRIRGEIELALEEQAAVALIGPRQAGKTTLALAIGEGRDAIYLDLEDPGDRARIADPRAYFDMHEDRLVILDEIHRMPDLFPQLRGVIDRGRRRGRRYGRFLLLGSASLDLLQRTGETLAGRIAYRELTPLTVLEVATSEAEIRRLWLRGGFPDSYLAPSTARSLRVRKDLIRTYLHRDIPMFSPRLAAGTLERFWTMLAHTQGAVLNQSRLAASLGVSAPAIARYVDLLADLLLVRRLPPVHANVGKRLVKSPKVYLRDSGLVHALLGIADQDALAGHPVVGGSWEGFVIETLLAAAPPLAQASYYRTSGGAEMDLVLDLPGGERWAVEVKLGRVPTLGRGFHHAREDLRPHRTFVLFSGDEGYPMSAGVEVITVRALAEQLAALE